MVNFKYGYVDKNGKLAIPQDYYLAYPFNGEVAAVMPSGKNAFRLINKKGEELYAQDIFYVANWYEGFMTFNVGGSRDPQGNIIGGRWGMIRENGKIVVKPQYDFAYNMSEGMLAVQKDGKWGYLNAEGSLVIPCEFDYAGDFKGGRTVVSQNGRDGFINKDGSWFMEPQFECANSFSQTENIARIKRGNLWYYINDKGEVISDGFLMAYAHRNGVALAKGSDEKFALVNAQGKIINNEWYDEFRPFADSQDNIISVRIADQWFGVKPSGEKIGPYAKLGAFSDGLAWITTPDQKLFGFIDPNGKVIIEPKYDDAFHFLENGYGYVSRNRKWTIIDTKGKELCEPVWDQVEIFGPDKLARVRKDGKWGAIDENGKVVIEPKFDDLASFSSGLAAAITVEWEKDTSAIDKKWHLVPEEGFDNPLFNNISADDQIRVIIGFAKALDPETYNKVLQASMNWQTVIRRKFGDYALAGAGVFVTYFNAAFRIQGSADPKTTVATLLKAIKEAGAVIKELIFAKLSLKTYAAEADKILDPNPDPYEAARHPDDPRGKDLYPDLPSYIKDVFDPKAVPPASENANDLCGAFVDYNMPRGLVFEERQMPHFDPQVRICYGLVQPDLSKLDKEDKRTKEIAAKLQAAIDSAFAPDRIWIYPPPSQEQPYYSPLAVQVKQDENGQYPPGINKFIAFDRTGYIFVIYPNQILQRVGPDLFRFREYELMQAIIKVIKELELDKVITWQRFGDVPENAFGHATQKKWPRVPYAYEFNLWEKKK